MPRYIDADKADIERIYNIHGECYIEDVKDWLDEQPTADAVEVIRCKDCAVPHNSWTGCPNLNGLIPPADFYCARGERKEQT